MRVSASTLGYAKVEEELRREGRKPKFEPAVRDDIDLYSVDQLRTFYHHAQGDDRTLIRLRNSNVGRDEVATEIRWRLHRAEFRFWLLAVMACRAAVASCASVILAGLALHHGGLLSGSRPAKFDRSAQRAANRARR